MDVIEVSDVHGDVISAHMGEDNWQETLMRANKLWMMSEAGESVSIVSVDNGIRYPIVQFGGITKRVNNETHTFITCPIKLIGLDGV